jgi:hypothetical protein
MTRGHPDLILLSFSPQIELPHFSSGLDDETLQHLVASLTKVGRRFLSTTPMIISAMPMRPTKACSWAVSKGLHLHRNLREFYFQHVHKVMFELASSGVLSRQFCAPIRELEQVEPVEPHTSPGCPFLKARRVQV